MNNKAYFEVEEQSGALKFSQVSKWASEIMNMYDNDMKFLKDTLYKEKNAMFNLAWKFWTERKPIYIYPNYELSELDASYSRVKHEKFGGVLKFNSYPGRNGKPVYTSQNKDVVSHETGHAMLDILRPDIYGEKRFQTQAIHESFGDLTCVFYLLSEFKNRIEVLKETKGDLSATSFLTLIGEPLDLNTKYGEIRNLKNDKKMGQTMCEEHDLSNVFSAAIYDLLVALFNSLRVYGKETQEEILRKVQFAIRILVLQSLIEVPYSNPSFSDIGQQMKKCAGNWEIFTKINFGKKIEEIFFEKEIYIGNAHTDDDERCRINLDQPDQSVKSSFCRTIKNKMI